jgi:hypothetical protein
MNKESENMGLLPYNFELQYSMEETNSRYNIYSPRQQSLEHWTIPFSVRRPRKTPTKNNVSFKTNITVVLKYVSSAILHYIWFKWKETGIDFMT